jgi:hypothetical protein
MSSIEQGSLTFCLFVCDVCRNKLICNLDVSSHLATFETHFILLFLLKRALSACYLLFFTRFLNFYHNAGVFFFLGRFFVLLLYFIYIIKTYVPFYISDDNYIFILIS